MPRNLLIHISFLVFVFANLYQSANTQPDKLVSPTEPSVENSDLVETTKPANSCEENLGDVVLFHRNTIKEFIDKANSYGNCGYRVGKFYKRQFSNEDTALQMLFDGYFIKEENNKYDYSWFIARHPGEAQTFSNNLAEKGFYLNKTLSFIERRCSEEVRKTKRRNDEDGMSVLNFGFGKMGAFFLFERKIGFPKKVEYRVLDGNTTTASLEENQRKFNDFIANGFLPVDLWWTGFAEYHFVVVERDESIIPTGDYIFLKKAMRIQKELDNFAKDGYNLLLMGYGFAILNRKKKEPLGIEYKKISDGKNLRKNFNEVAGLGFNDVIRAISDKYFGCDADDSEWFFTTPTKKSKNKLPKTDIKLLSLLDDTKEYLKVNGLKDNESSFTEEHRKKVENSFNEKVYKLIESGYEIREIGYLNDFTILLEPKK